MAILTVTATDRGVAVHDPGKPGPVDPGKTLARLPGTAPIVVLVHGYRYSPSFIGADPQQGIYSVCAAERRARYGSWPLGLGFRPDGRTDGLCLGFSWPATARDHPGPWRTRLARVYGAAEVAGARLAELVERIGAAAPGRPVDLLAHSLGARVALQAMAHLPPGRLGQVILMGGAEYDLPARHCLRSPGARGAQVFNVTSRENDAFDFLFRRFGPAPPPGARMLSHGLSGAFRNCFDLALDQPALAPMLARRGITLAPEIKRVCHWSFYTRPGAMQLYAEMLRNRHNWRPADLRAEAEAAALPLARRSRAHHRFPTWRSGDGPHPVAEA